MNTLSLIILSLILLIFIVFVADFTKVLIESITSFKPTGRYIKENIEWTPIHTIIYGISFVVILATFVWAITYLF